MRWVEWELSPVRPADCLECRELAEDNGKTVDCSTCTKPRTMSAENAQAWAVWTALDAYGREYDTMSGNPLPLRLEAIAIECGRHDDPDGLRQRVLSIERRVYQFRVERAHKGREK